MKLYKLTEQDYTTYYKSMTWKIGETNKVIEKENPQMCSGDVIHAYKNKNLALLLNPIHADIKNPKLLECEGNIIVEDYGKCGVFELTPTKKLSYPVWYKNEEKRKDVCIMFEILCSESVLKYYENKYPTDDRPREAITAAKKYLKLKTEDAARAAGYAYSDAVAYAAAYAADSAAYVAADEKIDFCELADNAVKMIMDKKI